MSLFNTTSDTLVNTSVVSVKNKTLLHWSILEVPEEVETVQQFFSDTVEGVAHNQTGFIFNNLLFLVATSFHYLLLYKISFRLQTLGNKI